MLDKQNLTKRLSKHVVESRKSIKKSYNHCWIKSLLDKGLKPKIENHE